MPRSPKPRPLKPQHALFVDHFIVDLDSGAAARRTDDAPVVASHLFGRADVKVAVAAAMAARAARTGVTV